MAVPTPPMPSTPKTFFSLSLELRHTVYANVVTEEVDLDYCCCPRSRAHQYDLLLTGHESSIRTILQRHRRRRLNPRLSLLLTNKQIRAEILTLPRPQLTISVRNISMLEDWAKDTTRAEAKPLCQVRIKGSLVSQKDLTRSAAGRDMVQRILWTLEWNFRRALELVFAYERFAWVPRKINMYLVDEKSAETGEKNVVWEVYLIRLEIEVVIDE